VAERKASDLFVECLEAEGVRHVFGIPGEQTLDLNASLEDSSITFVPVRHEQGGAYMADMYGPTLRRALDLEVPSLIVMPVDYSPAVSISQELGTETVAA
jgi:glyoxylate carboligase